VFGDKRPASLPCRIGCCDKVPGMVVSDFPDDRPGTAFSELRQKAKPIKATFQLVHVAGAS
jgi:hypothetical protein